MLILVAMLIIVNAVGIGLRDSYTTKGEAAFFSTIVAVIIWGLLNLGIYVINEGTAELGNTISNEPLTSITLVEDEYVVEYEDVNRTTELIKARSVTVELDGECSFEVIDYDVYRSWAWQPFPSSKTIKVLHSCPL